MASQCIHCIRSRFGVLKLIKSETRNFPSRKLCIKAKVPVDILNSKATSFSGENALFFDSENAQNIFKKLTGLNLDKIFASRKEEMSNPVYKVLDEKELKADQERIIQKAEQLLEMPPVMSRRKPIRVVLSEDTEIIGHDEDNADFVFTDISTSKNYRTCAVLVRENATGILREGTWDERDRMQFIYWPKEGQLHEIPPMLLDNGLSRVFDQLRHVDVLDLINIQCEPDSPDYIRVHERVYDDLETRQQYDVLHSTRHYGGMVFYYVKNKRTNALLSYYLRNQRISEGVDLVKLHLLFHDGNSVLLEDDVEEEQFLRRYLTENGQHTLLEVLEDQLTGTPLKA